MSFRSIAFVATAMLVVPLPSAEADPLQRPAHISPLATQRLIAGLSSAGDQRLVAVGQRGHILLSEDGGQQWTQVPVPLSSDLTAVQLVDDLTVYAVGHDGVVLASRDGGRVWSRILDGKLVNVLALEQLRATPEAVNHKRLLDELHRNVEAGPDKPFLDLYFSSPDEGFVVGAYNLLLHTDDGGRSWNSWYARTDNTSTMLNQYAVRRHRGTWFIAGEAGLLMRLDAARRHFVRIDTGYQGSFFGLLDAGDALIAHGMRGNAVISRDGGETWAPLVSGLRASITASTRGYDGSLWLADQFGNVVVSRDGGRQFKPVPLPGRQPVAALLATERALVLAGARGVRSLPLPKD